MTIVQDKTNFTQDFSDPADYDVSADYGALTVTPVFENGYTPPVANTPGDASYNNFYYVDPVTWSGDYIEDGNNNYEFSIGSTSLESDSNIIQFSSGDEVTVGGELPFGEDVPDVGFWGTDTCKVIIGTDADSHLTKEIWYTYTFYNVQQPVFSYSNLSGVFDSDTPKNLYVYKDPHVHSNIENSFDINILIPGDYQDNWQFYVDINQGISNNLSFTTPTTTDNTNYTSTATLTNDFSSVDPGVYTYKMILENEEGTKIYMSDSYTITVFQLNSINICNDNVVINNDEYVKNNESSYLENPEIGGSYSYSLTW